MSVPRAPRCVRPVTSAFWSSVVLFTLLVVTGSPVSRLPAWLDVGAAVLWPSAAMWTALPLVGLVLAGCVLSRALSVLPSFRGLPAPASWPWLALAAALSWSALETVVHNDGIVVLPGHAWWGPALHALVPLAAVLGVVVFRRFAERAPRYGAVSSLLLGGGTIAFVLKGPLPESYRALHAHLWLVAGLLLAAGGATVVVPGPLQGWLARASAWGAAILLGVSLGVGAAAGAFSVSSRILLQRFAFPLSGWFDAVPVLAWIHQDLLPTDEQPPSAAEARRFERELTDPKRLRSGTPRGRHVVLIVLESTRADLWGDPHVTPRFAALRKRGTWARRAVAQYPATPLAYGAMFTSQSPSVLVRSAYWARMRLFDALRGHFDDLFLSRPQVPWFDRSAITSFFVRKGEHVRRHASSAIALRALRHRIERLKPGRSLFAWVHLYEPHAPYHPPPPFLPAVRSLRARYEGELRYVDHHLGAFLEWFGRQPMARETLLVIVGDHGEGLGEPIMGRPFRGHHVHVHGVLSFVPMYLQGPGIPEGKVVQEPLLQQLDVMPTLFDFLGEDLPVEALPQGDSAYRLLAVPRRRPLVTEAFALRGTRFFDFVERAPRLSPAVLRDRFERLASTPGSHYAPKLGLQYGWEKLVFDRWLRRAWYFDTRTDPMERRDLSRMRPDRFASLLAMLRRWQRKQRWVAARLDEIIERTWPRVPDAGVRAPRDAGADGAARQVVPSSRRSDAIHRGGVQRSDDGGRSAPFLGTRKLNDLLERRRSGLPPGLVQPKRAPRQPERGAP